MTGRLVRAVLRRSLVGACCLLGAAGITWRTSAQAPGPIVYVLPVDGTIDLGIAPFLSRTLQDAQQAGAAAVLLEINTLGGRVDAAIAMRDALLASPIRTIAFVHPRAISAGALIALATTTIVMEPGGTIGAAMPVTGGVGPPQAADEKTVSYLRKEFAATAERRGRPRAFAEAMVDADVEIPGVVAKGKLLTLTTDEAQKHAVIDFVAASTAEALAAAGLPGADLRQASQTWAETLVRFLTNPVVSSLLMSLGLLGIMVEIRTPGFGLPGAVGMLALGLFFWAQWIVQLAGWEELLLVVAGTALMAAEIFVIPGFGLAGIAGILALAGGLGLALVGAGATPSVLLNALGQVSVSILLALGAGLAVLRWLPHLPFGRQLVLNTEMHAQAGYASPPDEDHRMLGRTGTALSPLRPAGMAEIDGARVDVVSDGTFIDAGTAIAVTRVDGNRVVVRPVTHAGMESSHD